MSFLLILIVILCIVNSQPQPQCLPSQTELFYENAENLTDWIFDTNGTAGYLYYAPYTDLCYDEACYGLIEYDYDSVTTTPNFVSKLGLISTIGFTDITINYALKHFAFDGPVSSADGECGSSYTVDGETFSTLDLHVADAGITYDEWKNSTMLIITESLGTDASNTATVQIRWEATSLWPNNSINSNAHYCLIDEIRLCGTAITTSTTTTATPTTTTPTTYHSDSGSDDSGSGSGDSSDRPSKTKTKLKLKRKKKSRSTSSESSESIYSALSSMNGVDDHGKNVNEQNVNFVISVAQQTSINLALIFVLFLFVCFFTFLCIYQYKAPPAAINNIV